MGPSSSPALVVSNGVLYCIYGANDLGNEMLVTASTDGSTWQGPRAYTAINMGATGPGAAAVANGITVGFQSHDARDVLFTTYKTTQAVTYTGASDPNGSGPQDHFQTPATQQTNVLMGSKPALATFYDNIYVAFQASNSSDNLFVSSTTIGSSYPGATGYPGIQVGSAPAMAVFNNKLYLAFQADNSSNNLFVTSSSDGSGFPSAAGQPNIHMGGAPALAVFNNKLFAAFQADDPNHHLFLTSSSDGQTWPDASFTPNVQIGSDPGMAVLNGKLYIAFRADDTTNALFITSSTDGVHFTSMPVPGQFVGANSSPTLVFFDETLYCIYGANDGGNEMLVTASTDGSTWTGPKAYTDIHMGATGPGATYYSGKEAQQGISVGFQSADPRDVLFTTVDTSITF